MRALIWVTCLLAAVWGGYWVVGSRGVDRAARDWFAGQAERGLIATYDDISVQGFPNRFDLTVSGIDLQDPATGAGWQAPFAQVFAMTWKPWHLIAALPNTQTVTLPDQQLTVESQRLVGSLLLVPGTDLALNEVVIETDAPKLSSSVGWQIGAERAVASLRADQSRKTGYRIGLAVTGFAPDPALQAATVQPDRIDDIHLDATFDLSAPLDRHAGEAQPRLTGLDLTEARLVWGDFKVFAKGSLAPDAEGLAEGEIAIRIEAWEKLPPLLAAMGVIAPDFAPTLTKGLEVMAKQGDDPKVLVLPLKAAGGRMSLGPFPLGPAPDWN